MKPLVVFGGECGMSLEPMQANWASPQVDLRYTDLLLVAVVTSGFL